ncbi:MAG TPA: hypothetical protein ENI56_03135 [Candidatus Kaiserbacteria bacterium]|nr:hypothetical protein [Candidatus Kaiserbacteria bacterium]
MKKNTLEKIKDASIVLALMVVIAAAVAAGALIIMSMIPSAHADGFQWRHFGAAPFAKTRVVAMRNRHDAFLALGIPAGAVRLLMKATEKPGTPTTLVVGQKLGAMISEGGKVHHNVIVAFGSPVRHMQYAAPAQMWQVTWKGEVYTVYLPEICHNWSVIVTPTKCVSDTFQVRRGDWVRLGVFTNGERLPSDCWSLSDGGIVSAIPSPCTACNWIGPLSVLPEGFMVEYSGLYRAHSRTQTLRFPREVTRDYIALCVIREGLGESDSWIIPPGAWKKTSIVHVPYGSAKWPVWGPAAITYGRP